MIPEQYHPTVEFIEDRVDEWTAMLDMPGVKIRHAFLATTNEEDHTTCALTASEWTYRAAKIEWYLPALAVQSLADIENMVVHELVHVLLGSIRSRLKSGSEDHEELATENVARALLAVRNATRGD